MRRILVTAVSALVCAGLAAQNPNLNPTVKVTNDYAGRTIDADRGSMPVEVPDSLTVFDLDFDYSGFETQYRGNDEFNPFFTELDLAKRRTSYRKLYLKAGAGYTLRPVFDLAWTITPERRFKLGAHASHKSYFGSYYGFDGYDSKTAAGLDGRADWDKMSLMASLDYDGIHAKDAFSGVWTDNTRSYNSATAKLRLMSTGDEYDRWRYDLSASYSFGSNVLGHTDAKRSNIENNIRVEGVGGVDFSSSSLEVGVLADVVFGNMDARYDGYSAKVSPRYRYVSERFSVSAGVSFLFTGGKNVLNSTIAEGVDGGFLPWPSLKLLWEIVPGKFELYADSEITAGLFGQRENAFKYHFNLSDTGAYITKTSNIDAGLRGNLFGKVVWRLNAGYELLQNAPLAVVGAIPGNPGFNGLFVYHDKALEDFNISLGMDARFGDFSLIGNVRYAAYLSKASHPVLPSPLTADLSARYEFANRASIYAGCDYRSAYSISAIEDDVLSVVAREVPHYIDLKAGADFRITTSMTVFVEGANLLNRSCQIIPGISAKGISITGGIVLNF